MITDRVASLGSATASRTAHAAAGNEHSDQVRRRGDQLFGHVLCNRRCLTGAERFRQLKRRVVRAKIPSNADLIQFLTAIAAVADLNADLAGVRAEFENSQAEVRPFFQLSSPM